MVIVSGEKVFPTIETVWVVGARCGAAGVRAGEGDGALVDGAGGGEDWEDGAGLPAGGGVTLGAIAFFRPMK